MKILTYTGLPFCLAHGGVTNIARKTSAVLEQLGFDVEPLSWWDDRQNADILFQFCRSDVTIVRYAKLKGLVVVTEQVNSGLVSRDRWKRRLQKAFKGCLEKFAPKMMTEPYGWSGYNMVDMHFVPSPHDASVISHMFDVPAEKLTVLPYGVDDEFLHVTKPSVKKEHLICTATVTERKRVLEVAEAASLARTPLVVVGKAYGESDPYSSRFRNVVAESNGIVEHIPHVDGREKLAEMLAGSRGFVLLSTCETVSQSALEAAACGCPLLLSDQDWARVAFANHAHYCPYNLSMAKMATRLRAFYDACPTLQQTFPAGSWIEKRSILKPVLTRLVENSRSK